MKYGLEDQTVEKINSVFKKFLKIDKVILYGSRAKGNFRRGSDIDLTMVGDDIDLSYFSKIEEALDDLMLVYNFDLSIFSQISDVDFLNHIKNFGVVFYERNK